MFLQAEHLQWLKQDHLSYKTTTKLNSKNLDADKLCVFHCIINKENLCAKLIKFTHVIFKTVTCINFTKSRPFITTSFVNFLKILRRNMGI
jgi:hypothetical protein